MIPDSVSSRPDLPEQTIERLVTKKDALCAGVELLLKRMESNPEEFAPHSGKWKDITNSIEQYGRGGAPSDLTFLTEHERSTLWEKYCEARKKHLHHSVMERILVNESTYQPTYLNTTQGFFKPGEITPYTPEDKAVVKLSLHEMLRKKLNSL